MTAPLLSTKLYIPRIQTLPQRTTLVPRSQLLKKLDNGLVGKLMLIAAPAGFGKSTLLSQWIDEVEGSSANAEPLTLPPRPDFCWLSLEESDNAPSQFWVYFIAALQSLNPELGANTTALLHSPEPPPLKTIITLLLNDLRTLSDDPPVDPTAEKFSETVSRIEPRIVLVLEDYHVIAAPTIHESLTFLLEHLPPILHLVMTTRADPPLPLARLRASGQLAEIRADDLRFTTAETTLFLNERMGLDLTPDDAQRLAARTEGWIAGLQLAAFAMHGHDDKSGFLQAFSGDHRYILNYLTEEVLNQQTQAVQKFLLHTSILTRLCGPLCDALIDIDSIPPADEAGSELQSADPAVVTEPNSYIMLERLDQANLFLVSLDNLGGWYRYHQLFAEVLQHRLRQSQPEILPILHKRASLWYAQQSLLSDAIRHALLVPDFAAAAELIGQAVSSLWNQGLSATILADSALPLTPPPVSVATSNQMLVEPLTDRELEVLRLVNAGLSNAAIAEQLVVTVGTVKSHLKHIFGKLSVRSRTQAAAQARELGLL